MKFSKTREVKTPTRGTENSAGLDFYIPVGYDQVINTNESVLIPTGIKANIPDGTMLQVCNKSGRACKGLIVGAEIVDSDYQGEMHMNVWNVSKKSITLSAGEKLVQMVLVPILLPTLQEVSEEELFNESTERGSGGFGSTGLK